jgi:hypothetical protein
VGRKYPVRRVIVTKALSGYDSLMVPRPCEPRGRF